MDTDLMSFVVSLSIGIFGGVRRKHDVTEVARSVICDVTMMYLWDRLHSTHAHLTRCRQIQSIRMSKYIPTYWLSQSIFLPRIDNYTHKITKITNIVLTSLALYGTI